MLRSGDSQSVQRRVRLRGPLELPPGTCDRLARSRCVACVEVWGNVWGGGEDNAVEGVQVCLARRGEGKGGAGGAKGLQATLATNGNCFYPPCWAATCHLLCVSGGGLLNFNI